jgi:hypothetical protein
VRACSRVRTGGVDDGTNIFSERVDTVNCLGQELHKVELWYRLRSVSLKSDIP